MSHPPTGWRHIVTGARTGIRFRFPSDPTLPNRSLSERCPLSCDTATDLPLMASSLKQSDLASALSFLDQKPEFRPFRWICDRVLLKQPSLLPTRVFRMSGLKDRVDNHHRVGCLEFYLEINSLEPDFRLVFLPSDVLRLRFPSESRKHCNPEFSTFPRKTCGGRWITQRFTAKNRSISSIPLRKQL